MVVFKFKELSVILKIISLYLICVSLIFHTTCISNSKKKIAIWGFTSLSYEFQLHAKSKTMIFLRWTLKTQMQQDSVLKRPLKLKTEGIIQTLILSAICVH